MRYAKRLAHRVIEGKAFVLEPRAKMMHSLNPAATRIWELAGKGSSEEQTAAALMAEFDVSAEKAKADTSLFLRRLVVMGLLESS